MNNTRFQMVGISVPQFAIIRQEMTSDSVGLSTEVSYRYVKEEPLMQASIRFTFWENSEKESLVILETVCDFAIHPDDWEELHQDGEIVIPQSLMEIMAVHTIGTARGILFCKTEGTPLANKLMIPPINVREMLK